MAPSNFAQLDESLRWLFELENLWFFHHLENIGQFIHQSLVSISHSDVWDIGSCDVVSSYSFLCVVWSQPVLFALKNKNEQFSNPNIFVLTKKMKQQTLWGNPLMRTEFLASSHISHELSFQTWAAMLYSSMRGSLVKWNCKGSSVERLITRPRARYSGSGLRW